MEKLKQWVVLTVVACLAIAAGGWFLVVSPKRDEAAELRAQAAQQESTNRGLVTQLEVLKAQAKDLPKEQAKLAAVAAKIPADPALPTLIRALLAASDKTGVELSSVAPGEPVLKVAAAPVAAAAPAQGQAAAPTEPTAAGTPGAAGPAGQLAEIPLSLNVVGSYFEVQAFLSELEELPRAVLVTALDLAPGASPTQKQASDPSRDGSSVSTNITATIFMAADRPAPQTATVPGAESASAEAPAADAAAAETAPAAN